MRAVSAPSSAGGAFRNGIAALRSTIIGADARAGAPTGATTGENAGARAKVAASIFSAEDPREIEIMIFPQQNQ